MGDIIIYQATPSSAEFLATLSSQYSDLEQAESP